MQCTWGGPRSAPARGLQPPRQAPVTPTTCSEQPPPTARWAEQTGHPVPGHLAERGRGTGGTRLPRPGVGVTRGGGLCHTQWPRVAMGSLDRAAVGPPGGEATCARVPWRPPPSTPVVYSTSGIKTRTTSDRKLRKIQKTPQKRISESTPQRWTTRALRCVLCEPGFGARTRTPRAGLTPCPGHPPVTLYNGHFPGWRRAARKPRTVPDVLGPTVLGAVLGSLPPRPEGQGA